MKLPKMRGKKIRFTPKLEGKKIVAIDLWQWNCRNGRKKNSSNLWQYCCRNGRGEKLWQLICGNGIAKMGGKKKNYGNGVAKNWRGKRERERERERENGPNKNIYIYIFGGVNHLTSSS